MADNSLDIIGLKEIHEQVYNFLRKIDQHSKNIKKSLEERVRNSKCHIEELDSKIANVSNKINISQMKMKNFDSVLLEKDSKYLSMMDNLSRIVQEDTNYETNMNILKENLTKSTNKNNNLDENDMIIQNQIQNIKSEIEKLDQGINGLESLLHIDINCIIKNINVLKDENFEPSIDDVIKTWENIKKCC